MVETFGTEQADPDGDRERGPRPVRLPAGRDHPRSASSRRPIYRETAAYGHFGRKEFPWEATDRVDDLRRAVG